MKRSDKLFAVITIVVGCLIATSAYTIAPLQLKTSLESFVFGFIEVPYNQAVQNKPYTIKLDTGSNNQLVNGSFDDQTEHKGWDEVSVGAWAKTDTGCLEGSCYEITTSTIGDAGTLQQTISVAEEYQYVGVVWAYRGATDGGEYEICAGSDCVTIGHTKGKWHPYQLYHFGANPIISVKPMDSFASGDTVDIKVDKARFGLSEGFDKLSGAHFVGSASWNDDCYFTDNPVDSTVSFTDYDNETSCTRSADGSVTTNTSGFSFDLLNVRTDGTYTINFNAQFLTLYRTASAACQWVVTDGTSVFGLKDLADVVNGENLVSDDLRVEGVRFNSSGNKNIKIQKKGRGNTGVECSVGSLSAESPMKATVHFFPDEQSTVVTQKSLTPDMAGFATLSFVEINHANWKRANGDCVLKSEYPDYTRNVKKSDGSYVYGECTVSTTNDGVNLPDMETNNLFIRAASDSLALGTEQEDTFQEFEFASSLRNTISSDSVALDGHAYGEGFAGFSSAGTNGVDYVSIDGRNNDLIRSAENNSVKPRTSNETRPKNMALYAYVRMVDGNVIHGSFEAIKSSETCQVEARDHSNEDITANTEDIPFKTIIKDNCNAWSNAGNTGNNTNDAFTAPRKMRVLVTGGNRFAVNETGGANVNAFVNGTWVKTIGRGIDEIVPTFSGTVDLQEGDVLTIRSNKSPTLSNAGGDALEYHHIEITELPDTQSIVDNLSDNGRLKKDQYSTTEMKWGKWNGEQLYRRCFTVGSDVTTDTTTVATFAIGLKPKQSVQYASTNQWLIQSATVASSSATYFRLWYNDTNGEITASLNGWKIGAGTSFCMDYTK